MRFPRRAFALAAASAALALPILAAGPASADSGPHGWWYPGHHNHHGDTVVCNNVLSDVIAVNLPILSPGGSQVC